MKPSRRTQECCTIAMEGRPPCRPRFLCGRERACLFKYSLVLLCICTVVRPLAALTPGDLSRVRFEQHPGHRISGDLAFRDENDRPVKLADFFGTQPAILVLGYYRCPMLCTMINDGLINALENLRSSVGSDFQVVDLSIDPNEKAAAAAEKKSLYLRRYGRSGAAKGWHCLVGDAKPISQLAEELGYRYAYDPQTRQYAHPSGVVVLTPSGKISRYVFGVNFDAKELQDALVAAKEERSNSILSQLVLLCFHYNPITGKYSALILSILRASSVATVAAVIVFVVWMVGRDNASPARTRARRGFMLERAQTDGFSQSRDLDQ